MIIYISYKLHQYLTSTLITFEYLSCICIILFLDPQTKKNNNPQRGRCFPQLPRTSENQQKKSEEHLEWSHTTPTSSWKSSMSSSRRRRISHPQAGCKQQTSRCLQLSLLLCWGHVTPHVSCLPFYLVLSVFNKPLYLFECLFPNRNFVREAVNMFLSSPPCKNENGMTQIHF